jgi:hypothetical protein
MSRPCLRAWPLAACGLAAVLSVQGQTVEPLTFEAPADLSRLAVQGNAVVDTARKHGGASSLRLDPGASVEWKLRDADGSGKVELWVYEGMNQPANPKDRVVGPRWGIRQADGRMLVVGQLFAPYLAGDTTYTASETADGKAWFTKVTYLGESKRAEGWHQWTFDFDAKKGLSILLDGKDVNARRKRYDWNASSVVGFASVVVFGGAAGSWPLWVDDLSAVLGGPMEVAPIPPPPPPPVVPDKDPAAAQPVALGYKDLKVHPRLLFGPEDVEALRAFVASPAGKPLMDQLLAYRQASRPGAGTEFLKDATDGQRQGFWRMPTVALHYVLTGDAQSLADTAAFLRKFNELPNWEIGAERDSGMSAANIMIGAALAYDWTYDALDPALRDAFRRKLWHHARAMYHGGHLMKNAGTHYWQNDPHNNHRWHRNAGMALCALAAAGGAAEEQWLLGEIRRELDFVARWLPADGTSHESPSYLVFGGSHLLLALQASDRAFGTAYLQLPFCRNTALFRLQSLKPGFRDAFSYGDGAGLGSYNGYCWKTASVHKQADILAGLERLRAASPKAFEFAWFDILWKDPALAAGDLARVPTKVVFPDIGTLFIRDSWRDSAVAAMFKCCPFGGHTLNRFRNEADFKYINVAHDDPDANSFVVNIGAANVVETDRYSKSKKSANHNTVLVNGVGQEAAGRSEGGGWTQPATGRTDMSRMGYLTAWKNAGKIVAVEGEAAGSYLALNDRRRGVQRPALERFRRTFVWVEGEYLLVLDDLRAPAEVTYDWLMQAPKLEAVDAAALRYSLADGGASCAFQIASDAALSTAIRESPADHRGDKIGHQQLVATAKTARMRVASVYAPWGGDASVVLEPASEFAATVRVKRGADTDTWRWEAAEAADKPGRLKLDAGARRAFELTPADVAPDPEGEPQW